MAPLAPPKIYDIEDRAKTLISDSGIVAAMGGNGAIYVAKGDIAERTQVGWPAAANDGFRWRIVLMKELQGLAGQDEHLDKVRGVPFRVRIDLDPPNTGANESLEDIGFDPEHFLEQAHNLVYAALQYQKITPAGADLLHSIIRKSPATPMYRDENQGWLFMSAAYITIVGPKT